MNSLKESSMSARQSCAPGSSLERSSSPVASALSCIHRRGRFGRVSAGCLSWPPPDVRVRADEPLLLDRDVLGLDLGPYRDGVVLAVLVRGDGMVGVVDDPAQVGVVPPEVVPAEGYVRGGNAERSHGVPHPDELDADLARFARAERDRLGV